MFFDRERPTEERSLALILGIVSRFVLGRQLECDEIGHRAAHPGRHDHSRAK